MSNTPILFIVFNRPELTKKGFQSIRRAMPTKLYVASDGPRETSKGEAEIVRSIREYIISSINWDCEVYQFFRKVNVGCGPNVKEAIDWLFANEDEGIIIEDDVIPEPGFYRFCEELLERYRNDERIGMISGNNHVSRWPSGDSYLFSRYKGCWGWATWRRSWKNMDYEMGWLSSKNRNSIIANMGYGEASEVHWRNAIKLIKNGAVNAWDWQWYFSLSAQNQVCIFPRYNLVSNIGFGEEATHTSGRPKNAYVRSQDIEFPLVHPIGVVANCEYDRLFENLKIRNTAIRRYAPASVKKIVKKVFRLHS